MVFLIYYSTLERFLHNQLRFLCYLDLKPQWGLENNYSISTKKRKSKRFWKLYSNDAVEVSNSNSIEISTLQKHGHNLGEMSETLHIGCDVIIIMAVC